MTEPINHLKELLHFECKRLRALGLSVADIEARLHVSESLIREVVTEEFYTPIASKPAGLPDRAGAITYVRGK
jgi:hypothetical protein